MSGTIIITKQLYRRFWSKVNITANDEKCWEWNASLKNGYGQLFIKRNQPMEYAHRLSWQMAFGEISNGLWVLHKCDNPKCVNPKHLFLGTQQDNMDDMKLKHREAPGSIKARKGVAHGMHRLTENQVVDIRSRYKNGDNYATISRMVNVDESHVRRIVLGKSWKHILEESVK